MGGLGVSFLATWTPEGGLWAPFSRASSPVVGLTSDGETQDRDFRMRILAPCVGTRRQLSVTSTDLWMMVSAGKSRQ